MDQNLRSVLMNKGIDPDQWYAAFQATKGTEFADYLLAREALTYARCQTYEQGNKVLDIAADRWPLREIVGV